MKAPPGFLGKLADLARSSGRRIFASRGRPRGRRAFLSMPGAPLLGEILKHNIGGIRAGPWHRIVRADWLGPYTPTYVMPWQLKLMRDDPQIALGLKVIRAAFFGIEWRLKGGTPRSRALVKRTLLEAPIFTRLLRSILNCLDFGYQAHEVVWERVDDFEYTPDERNALPETLERAYRIRDFSDLDPEYTQLMVDLHGQFRGLKWHGTQYLPPEKCLLAIRGYEYRNFYGRSLLKCAFLPWYWANWLTAWLMRYAECRVTPPIIATAPYDFRDIENEDTTQQEQNALEVVATQAALLRNGSIAAIPHEPDEKGNNKFSLQLLQDAGRIDQFMIALHYFNTMKLRAFGIPERTVTQDTATGSFAMADAHVDIFLQSLEEHKVGDVEPAFNVASAQITRANFGRGEAAPLVEGTPLARQKQKVQEALVIAGLNTPQTLPDGRVYTPSELIDYRRSLQDLNMPVRDPEDVARTKLIPPAPAPAPTTKAPGASQLERAA